MSYWCGLAIPYGGPVHDMLLFAATATPAFRNSARRYCTCIIMHILQRVSHRYLLPGPKPQNSICSLSSQVLFCYLTCKVAWCSWVRWCCEYRILISEKMIINSIEVPSVYVQSNSFSVFPLVLLGVSLQHKMSWPTSATSTWLVFKHHILRSR